jgi:hypothetical protein
VVKLNKGANIKDDGREQVDPRTRSYVLPTRVVWTSAATGDSSVADAGILLGPRFGQVPEGEFLAGSGCRLENRGQPASLLLDFGCELHGGVQLASGGLSGKKLNVRVRFGESVAEAMAELGERGAGNDHAIRDSVLELPWLGTREIGTTGFRFVRVDLVSPGVLRLESVRAVSLMRPLTYHGAFRCSDDRLNTIWATAARTLHLCCQDYIWDGIKRDRLVWMGDLHPELMTLMAVFGPQAVVNRSLDYMRQTTPADQWMNGMPSYTLWWVRCQHDWFHYTGDLAYLTEQHAYLRAVLERLAAFIGADDRCAMPGGFLDWPTQHNARAVAAGMHALMLMTFDDGARLAVALKDAALAAQCRASAARLRTQTPAPEGSKQAAALLVLAGLAEAKTMNATVLAADGVKGMSTFYGYYMLEARAKAGDLQGALDALRTYWGGMLDLGATSFWEDFNPDWAKNAFRIDELPVPDKTDIHGDCGEFCYAGFRHSLCHGWASGPAPWLTAHVLGIQVAAVGCRTLRVQPFLGDLAWAEGAFPTPLGVVRVRHEKQANGSITSAITAPEGITIQRG